MQNFRAAWLHGLTLLASSGTLICCALPALFVALGAGAVLAGLVAAVPQLVWLSAHKAELFAAAGILLALSGWVQYKNRHAPCPADPAKAEACMRLRRVSAVVYVASMSIYGVGFFFAFLAPYLWR